MKHVNDLHVIKKCKKYRMYKNNRRSKDRYIRCDFSEKDTTSDISHISSFIMNIVPFNEHGLRQIDYQVQ